ncbi:triphosphoribosyl-dephospho-CoA synthase [Halobaculum lipolyticum]|uniref:Triphosphoribosyl-dephospho-CoA synthase n=1 Tax=Halobaculum lipolyticum TaxID=3032001 RepID=A0ABD5W7F5_9EURY|nr:triphosphoribosyl-dephospho-CoA synthase [Halobaculum sp. DT31]
MTGEDGTGDADGDRPRRGPAANAELALLLEVAGTPKPGNVDRRRDLANLRFEQFLAGAVGARPGLERAAAGDPVGEAFETAVAGMSEQSGGNTQFGCLLLLVPLVRAAAAGDLTAEGVREVCAATTVDDAAGFYRAFEHVDVAVADPPEGLDALDVRRGADAVPALRERGATLLDVLSASAAPVDESGTPRDANAHEWVAGFPRTFRAAEAIRDDEGPVTDRAARAFLDLLAETEDTLVRTRHGAEVAREVRDRAAEVASLDEAEEWADDLVGRGINPGTTADLTAAALFVALERGVTV